MKIQNKTRSNFNTSTESREVKRSHRCGFSHFEKNVANSTIQPSK